MRRIQLDPVAPPAGQVELALEAGAPFALEQLYYGFVLAAGGDQALVAATHRRLFPAADWAGATAVLPAFWPLLGNPPAGPLVRLWRQEDGLTLAVWDGVGSLPVCVLGRQIGAADASRARAALLDEVVARLGGDLPPVEEYAGPPEVRPLSRHGGFEFRLRSGSVPLGDLVSRLDATALEAADLRDKAVLADRRHRQQQDRWLWRGFAGAAAAVLAAALLEFGVVLAGGSMARQRTAQMEQAGWVREIETAHSLGARIEEMAERRFRPLEMLAMLNDQRPPPIQFVRIVNQGQRTLEIDGQAGEAGSVGVFEAALRALPALEKVEFRDVRLRDGLTHFQLTAVFRPGAFAAEGGGP